MALLHDSVNSKKYDVRLVERNIARGLISAKEFEEAIKNLPDDSENAEYISIETLENDADLGSSNGSGSHSH
jgi:hypothetical protein